MFSDIYKLRKICIFLNVFLVDCEIQRWDDRNFE